LYAPLQLVRSLFNFLNYYGVENTDFIAVVAWFWYLYDHRMPTRTKLTLKEEHEKLF